MYQRVVMEASSASVGNLSSMLKPSQAGVPRIASRRVAARRQKVEVVSFGNRGLNSYALTQVVKPSSMWNQAGAPQVVCRALPNDVKQTQ